MKEKHVPTRTCIVTKEKRSKNDLIRVVRQLGGVPEIMVDPRGKMKGRGANISPDEKVFQTAVESGILAKALKLERDISPSEKQRLAAEFRSAVEEKTFRKGQKNVTIKVSRKELEEKLGAGVEPF